MSKTGSANGSFLGNFIYDQLLSRRPHFLHDLFRAVDFVFVNAALKDFYGDWRRDPWDPMVALVVNLKRGVALLKLRSPAFSWIHAA
jgi:hypothetical protein